MHSLRAVSVVEHSFLAIEDVIGETDSFLDGNRQTFITNADAVLLDAMGARRPGFSQRVIGGVKLAQFCGIIRLRSCVLEVLPKIGSGEDPSSDDLARSRAALLTMLNSSPDVPIATLDGAPQRPVNAALLEVFLRAFLKCALEIGRRGLLSRYVRHADEIPVIKGSFKVQVQFRKNLTRPHMFHCEYDDFTDDNPYNHAIAATIGACRPWIQTSSTLHLWSETHSRYSNISKIPVTAKGISRLPRERTTRHYDAALTWCQWLLEFFSPSMSAGSLEAPALLFDMNKLFESHVCLLEERAAADDKRVVRQGPVRNLAIRANDRVFRLRPDITIWRNGKDGTPIIEQIADAKWKRLVLDEPDWGIAGTDIYQVLAYSLRYGCRRIRLIFPRPDGFSQDGPCPVFRIEQADLEGLPSMPIVITVHLVALVAQY